ncbi:MAG TPA: hypothetical protein VFR81_21415 [Longimicrobium sp.]|nr:hypothetical protein [Longimicrobium sp.]
MRSKLRTAVMVAFCAAASLAASQCGPSRSSRQPTDEAPAPGRLEARTWTPQSSPDSIAAWVLAGCRGRSNKGECVEKALISTIEPAGVDRSMAALLIVAGKDEDIRRDGHVYAHGIGIAAYTTPETVSQAFGRCTTDFQSGCYHGVIQGFFSDQTGGAGVTQEKLNALCADYRTPDKRWLDFQCSHGAGHGLMAVNGHHLLKALDACDLFTDVFERQGCWGGAFMENVVNATNPHHTSVTQAGGHDHGGGQQAQAGHGEHGAHGDSAAAGHDEHAGHGQTAAAEPFKALDKDEPLYPCNVVKEHHRRQCYLMQTSAILFHSNGDFSDASKQCQRAPEEMRETCFQSLGRDANSWARGSRERAIRYCGAAPEEMQAFCIVGTVKNIVDVTAVATDGLDFCKLVPGHTKPACYRAVGQQIALLRPTPAARERECAAAESGYLTECRFGAGLGLLRTEDE